jgi:hypothetical protein
MWNFHSFLASSFTTLFLSFLDSKTSEQRKGLYFRGRNVISVSPFLVFVSRICAILLSTCIVLFTFLGWSQKLQGVTKWKARSKPPTTSPNNALFPCMNVQKVYCVSKHKRRIMELVQEHKTSRSTPKA